MAVDKTIRTCVEQDSQRHHFWSSWSKKIRRLMNKRCDQSSPHTSRLAYSPTSAPPSVTSHDVTLRTSRATSPGGRDSNDSRFGASPPGGSSRRSGGMEAEDIRLGVSYATPPSGGRGRPSDSGYGTDSPASLNTNAIQFRYEDEMEVEEGAVGYSGACETDQHVEGLGDDEDYSLGVPEMEDVEEEEDDDVFLQTPVVDFQLSYDDIDGDHPQDRGDSSESDSHTTSSSQPIDIPRPLAVPNQFPNLSLTPPRFTSNQVMAFSPGGLWMGSPRRGSEGHLAAAGMFALATRLHSPGNRHQPVVPPANQFHLDFGEQRPRFFSFSEGDNHRHTLSHPGVGDDTSASAAHAARVAARRQLPFRDRALSEPAIQVRLQRQFGRELRRISDEFHMSYQIVRTVERGNGVRPHSISESASFPGGRGRRGSWWESILHMLSPSRLETIESPGIQDHESHPLSLDNEVHSNSPVEDNGHHSNRQMEVNDESNSDHHADNGHHGNVDRVDDDIFDEVDGIFMVDDAGAEESLGD